MEAKKKRDLTSTAAIQGLAKWMRKESGALVVIILRVDDLAISADPLCAPRESQHLIEDRMPELHERLAAIRAEALQKQDRRNEKAGNGIFREARHGR